jgi:hypothetical protein
MAYIGNRVATSGTSIKADKSAPANSLRVKSNGNIGVGVAEPSSKLHVAGTVTATAFAGDGSALTGIESLPAAIDVNGSAPGDSLAIDSAGKVGIGTTSPLTNLVTVGTSMATSQAFVGSVADTSYSGGIINLSNSSRSIGITADPTNAGTGSLINFSVDGSERMRIDSSGKVGIGATSPTTSLEINAANTLGATFTGTTAGEGVEVSQTSYTANNYVSLIEGKYLASQAAPHVRIGAQYTGSGSKLVFGTSNSYGSGITNSALIIDPSGDITTSGKITPGTYRPGEIIETIACMCDGSTVSVLSGDYTITNCSAAQSSTSSYVVMTGSSVAYTPPAGTKRVLYRYNFKFDVTGYSGISHFKVQVDGTDVIPSSRNYSSNYASTNWHHANLELGVEWVFDCDAASDDAANGKFTSWTSAKTIRGVHRHYGGGYAHRLHGNVWWDGAGASGTRNAPIKPFLYIQAIA